MTFVGGNQANQSQNQPQPSQQQSAPPPAPESVGFDDFDDDIPF
jgi:single-stranded DNA-binding protein